MSDTDLDLLARYTKHHAEDAFAEIVRRHLDLVHSAALRQVRSPQLAEEVAQSTFINLARHAHRLAPGTILAAWLYQVARREAIDVVRREARRQLREQIATEMNAMNATAADWTHIEPLLDDAMHALDETDRAAVLLRYFENKSLREVGATLGASENAAQKRLSRAVERLREFFAKRGVTVGASGLVVALSANAIQAAPVGLAATLSAASLASIATANGTLTALKFMISTNLKAGALGAVVVASAVTSVVMQHNSQAKVRNSEEILRQQAVQLTQLQGEHERLANISALANGSSENNQDELLRLRDEVARLRSQTNNLASLRETRRQLEASLGMARQRTDGNISQPPGLLEEARARVGYCGQLALALREYAADHQGQFPTNFEQAASFVSARLKNETNFTTSQFEIVYRGSETSLSKFAQPGSILLSKEKNPWKTAAGQWAKVYAFCDAGCVALSAADGNFEDWEKQHTVLPESAKP
jgi:RNA polymerase sigma factor (sigma-70 family)